MTRDQIITKASVLRKNGASYSEIASDLYHAGVKSPRGGKYSGAAIAKMLDRAPKAMPQPVAAATKNEAPANKRDALFWSVLESNFSTENKLALINVMLREDL